VNRIRKFSSLPVAVGFGISGAEQFQAVGKFADAAVIGSAIVSLIEKHGAGSVEPVADFVRGLRANKPASSATGAVR
jgi:tryptophan synthase alpha chain